jgi:hypothetical protein
MITHTNIYIVRERMKLYHWDNDEGTMSEGQWEEGERKKILKNEKY